MGFLMASTILCLAILADMVLTTIRPTWSPDKRPDRQEDILFDKWDEDGVDAFMPKGAWVGVDDLIHELGILEFKTRKKEDLRSVIHTMKLKRSEQREAKSGRNVAEYVLLVLHAIVVITMAVAIFIFFSNTTWFAAGLLNELVVTVKVTLPLWLLRLILVAMPWVYRQFLAEPAIPEDDYSSDDQGHVGLAAITLIDGPGDRPVYCILFILDIVSALLCWGAMFYTLCCMSEVTMYAPYHAEAFGLPIQTRHRGKDALSGVDHHQSALSIQQFQQHQQQQLQMKQQQPQQRHSSFGSATRKTPVPAVQFQQSMQKFITATTTGGGGGSDAAFGGSGGHRVSSGGLRPPSVGTTATGDHLGEEEGEGIDDDVDGDDDGPMGPAPPQTLIEAYQQVRRQQREESEIRQYNEQQLATAFPLFRSSISGDRVESASKKISASASRSESSPPPSTNTSAVAIESEAPQPPPPLSADLQQQHPVVTMSPTILSPREQL